MAIPDELKQVAERTVLANRDGGTRALLDEVYANEAVSVEAQAMPGETGHEAAGLDAIRAKWDWWEGAHDVHAVEVDGPFYHGADRFGVVYTMDVTERGSGERTRMRELGVYTVRDGKIVREEFFY